MEQHPSNGPRTWRTLAWGTTLLAGVAVPVALLSTLSQSSSRLASGGSPTFTLGLMGAGIIGAATAGRLWIGVPLALVNAAGLVVLALALGMPAFLHPVSAGLAMIIASGSFAARGALFATTLSHRGWLMALFVVAGEASVLLIAYAWPGALPGWFLALLPAQWASVAIQTALTGTGVLAAAPVLIALAGTAATTLLAKRLWLHRWPYALMFTTWLGMSALVYFCSAPKAPGAALDPVDGVLEDGVLDSHASGWSAGPDGVLDSHASVDTHRDTGNQPQPGRSDRPRLARWVTHAPSSSIPSSPASTTA